MRSLITVTIALLIAFCGLTAQDYWEKTGDLPTGPVKALKYDEGKSRLVAGIDGRGVYISDDGGASWQESNDGLTNFLISDIDISSGGDYYVATNGGGIFKLTGGTGAWAGINGDLNDMNILAFDYDDANDILYAGTWFTEGSVYVSSNGGENWYRADLGDNKDVHEVFVASDGNVYAATQMFGIYLSTDNGETWNETGNLSGDNAYAIGEDADNNLYAGMNNGIYRWQNGAWIKVSPKEGPPGYIRCFYSYGDVMYAGSLVSGTYRADIEKMRWGAFNEGFPQNIAVLDLAVGDGEVLFAATNAGVYKSTNFTGVEEEYIADFSEIAAFPNPFMESVTITAFFSDPGYTKVKIYDQLGILRETIFDGYVNAGLADFKWKPDGLNQGIYLYMIETKGKIRTGKIIFQK